MSNRWVGLLVCVLLLGPSVTSVHGAEFLPGTDDDWWVRTSRLEGPHPTSDRFGSAVSLDGDVALVGDRSAGPGFEGRAIVFKRTGPTAWDRAQLLNPSDPGQNRFGGAVAAEDDLAIVTDSLNDRSYVYERDSTKQWSLVERLFPGVSDGPGFGRAVDIDEESIAIGDPEADNRGAVHVFAPAGDGTWTREARLFAPDNEEAIHLGDEVALHDGMLIAGAPTAGVWASPEDDVHGVAHLFERDGPGNWSHVARLKPDDPGTEYAGVAVAIGNGVAAVGDTEASAERGTGAVYVFEEQPNGGWDQVAKLAPRAQTPVDFGAEVVIEGDTLVTSDPTDGNTPGSVFVFERSSSGQWEQTQTLLPPDGLQFAFGQALGSDGNRLLVGDPTATNGPQGPEARLHVDGAAYVYEDLELVPAP